MCERTSALATWSRNTMTRLSVQNTPSEPSRGTIEAPGAAGSPPSAAGTDSPGGNASSEGIRAPLAQAIEIAARHAVGDDPPAAGALLARRRRGADPQFARVARPQLHR